MLWKNWREFNGISIHALARRATWDSTAPTVASTDFNPRSRKESDPPQCLCTATILHFNPRSRKESDASFGSIGRNLMEFQSTLSQGERQDSVLSTPSGEGISIHALARRATRDSIKSDQRDHHFNPRSRKESDALTDNLFLTSVDFNPRSRKESDSSQRLCTAAFLHFNPRSRKESDSYI